MINHENQIRKRKSYKYFENILQILTMKDLSDQLEFFHQLKDRHFLYNSRKNSNYAKESLDQIKKDYHLRREIL